MYANILSQILSRDLSVEDFRNWLRYEVINNEILEAANRFDFAVYFLSYLRSQANFLETRSSNTPSSTPVKGTFKAPPHTHDPVSSHNQGKQRRSCIRKLPLGSENKNDHSSYEMNDAQGRRKPQQTRQGSQQVPLASFIVTTKMSQRERKNARANITLNSNNFPELGSSKRRIKPTSAPVQCQQQENLAPNPFTSAPEVSTSNAALERALLKLECSIVQKKDISTACLDQLTTLSKIYSSILNHDLELNFMNEVYFLTELLCVQIKPENENASDIFGDSHSCSYFAAKTLSLLNNFFEHLEPALIKLFVENSVVEEVCPGLVVKLRKTLPSIRSRPLNLSTVIETPLEREHRKNFSSPDTFQMHRKQRDTFYAVLNSWENDRCFSRGLVRETLSIFELALKEPENYAYFSRLFVSQLISSCIGDGSESATLDGPKDAIDNPLPIKVDPVKLKRLQDRLVTPAKALSGPCPPPEFSGWEEFFRDFIVIASDCNFNFHLQDALICRLHALNNQKFRYTETHPNGTLKSFTVNSSSTFKFTVFAVEDDAKDKFLACVLSAQLVAKFLGFIQFLPYRSTFKKVSENIILEQLAIREKVNPIVNTHDTLVIAAKNCRLTLTVPWMCSYLVQMDVVTLRSPYVQATISLLASLQRGLSHRALPGASMLLIRLNIGWCLTLIAEICPSLFDAYRSDSNSHNFTKIPKNPDYLDLLDSKCISMVCPFLSELRSLLAGAGGNLSVGTKHITPIAAEAINPALQLELQLEESFIQTQPSNVKQTLTFITERLTSLCTEFLETDTITPVILDLESQVHAKVHSEAKFIDQNLKFSEKVVAVKKSLEVWSMTTAEEKSALILEKCLQEADVFIKNRCSSLLEQLLPRNVSTVQSNAFAQIIHKNICAKLKTWVETNHGLKPTLKRVKECVEKTAKQIAKLAESSVKVDLNNSIRLPEDRKEPQHLESALSPADTLISIKELILQMMSLQAVPASTIKSTISDVERVICHRADLVPDAYFILKPLTVDLALWIVATQPEMMVEDLINLFSTLWSESLGRPDQLDRMFCPRYMQMLCDSNDRHGSCASFERLLLGLLATQLLTHDGIEQQAIAVFRQEWPQEFLDLYTRLVQNLCSVNQCSDEESFTPLLPWLADYCSNLDDLPEDED